MGRFTQILILVLFSLIFRESEGQCVDEEGQHVDWTIMYKLPKNSEEVKPKHKDIIEEGLGYMYINPNTIKKSSKLWYKSKHSVKDDNSIMGRLLSPIYPQKKNEELFRLFYNDEHPDGNTSFTRGHTKGVLVMTKATGFWLVHSVPKYPPNMDDENASYDYPHTGQMYGQSFLCISLNTSESANAIGRQMRFNQPYMYSVYVPKWVKEKYPELANAANGKFVKKAPFYNHVTFKSLAGVPFTSFAKANHFGKELYSDYVAPFLKTNLMVETWPNGPGKMNSSCDKPQKVLNVDAIDFHTPKPDIDFVTKKDHSKWAISYGSMSKIGIVDTKFFVCIGDINRMETQKKRGGGTVCFQSSSVWHAFVNIVKKLETCKK